MSARKSDNGHGREYLIMDENLRNEIDDLVADREKFNKFVYTPIDEAVKEVKKRASNEDLKKYSELSSKHLEQGLSADIRELLK